MTSIDLKTCNISTIIPTRNEAPRLAGLLAALPGSGLADLLVVDGGSSDATCDIVRAAGVPLLHSPPGRGPQLRLGAAKARGPLLFFLHADTLPPPDCAAIIRRTLSLPDTAAGVFRLRLDAPGLFPRLLELGANLRSSLGRLPYGDQGLFLSRSSYDAVGGYPSWPLLEDVDLVRRLRARGRVRLTPESVRSSARRWQQRGWLRVTVIHQLLLAGYLLGVAPARLAHWRWRWG